MTTLIDYALMAGAAYISNRDAKNQIPAPKDWAMFAHVPNNPDYPMFTSASGFEAVSFQNKANPNEIVISFAGTDFSDGLISLFQSDFWKGNIPLISGVSVNGADQLVDAVEYYLKVKNDPANAGKTISLTGHSLGGGLASLVGVFFGESAATFDEIPAAATAGHSQATLLYNELRKRGHTVKELASLGAYVAATDPLNTNPNPADTFAARTARIADVYVNGEVASIIPRAQRIGSDARLNLGSNGVGASDLHSIALLNAMQQSGDTAATTPADGKNGDGARIIWEYRAPSPIFLTASQATDFTSRYTIVSHLPNTASGFSATLMKDNATGAYTLSIRSTEYFNPSQGGGWARDGLPGADGEIGNNGFAFGQIASMESYYEHLKRGETLDAKWQWVVSTDQNMIDFSTKFGGTTPAAGVVLNVSGYSLSGQLAVIFKELHPEVSNACVFNGTGKGNITQLFGRAAHNDTEWRMAA